ncbi:MAG: Mur ligase family protein [Nannocystaceae bacterium]
MLDEVPAWQRELFARRSFGVRLGLERVKWAHERLGRPGASIPAIHVVGTNGKGSTSAMIAHGLLRSGRRVGLYTSPHLHRVGERVRIDGVPLEDEVLRGYVERVLALADEGELGRTLTFFEILTVAALIAFDEHGVDIAVVECGLGGRLDATRIVSVALTLFVSISRDHMAYLGPTITAITLEKAAVLEDGAPARSVIQTPEVAAILRHSAARFGVDLQFVDPLPSPPLGLRGEHQRRNAGLALAALEHFLGPVEPSLLDGVRWPGRLEEVAVGDGRVIFDVGHNLDGIQAVVAHLQRTPPPPAGRLIVFGCMADKEGPAMVELLVGLGDPLYLVPPGDGDGWSPAVLGASAPLARVARDLEDPSFWAAWTAHLRDGGEIVALGSHHLVAWLRGHVLGSRRDPLVLSDPLVRTNR